MRLLYSLLISLVKFLLPIFSLFSNKIKEFLNSRKKAVSKKTLILSSDQPVFWMHVASLGEYEQGLPLLRKWKDKHPGDQRLITFFSPSGYEVKKDSAEAEHVGYLPLDTPAAVRDFLDFWKPSLVVLVKYEIWPNLLWQMHQRSIPVFLMSARFHASQVYFKSYGRWLLNHLNYFKTIFVQNSESVDLLKHRIATPVLLSGDSRFDRVEATRIAAEQLPFVDVFKDNKRLIVLGSSWPEDEQAFLSTLNTENQFKWLIAPHQLHEDQLDRLLKQLSRSSIRFSQLIKSSDGEVSLHPEQITALKKVDVLILDTIGLLSRAYQYADTAYIGGGFSSGLHNILEAVVFGIPVLIGPKYKKFPEATDLVKKGGVFSVKDDQEFTDQLQRLFQDQNQLEEVKKINRSYCESQLGTTEKVFQVINEFVKNRLD